MELRWPRRATPYLFVAPALLVYGTFVLLPVGQTTVMSFWKWDGLSADYSWVGLSNYVAVLASARVWSALSHNAIWVVLALVPIALGLALAVVLQQFAPKGRGIYRVLFFMPYVLPQVVLGLIWNWIYNPNWGVLNGLFRGVGLDAWTQNWLGNPNIALFALVAAANWAGYGYCMILFLSGLNAIDPSLYEAAQLDGAGAWQQFRYVTWPSLANTRNVVILLVFINTVRVFDIVWVMTAGGPNGATEVLGTLIYRNTFQDLNMGQGSAMAVLMVAIILLCTMLFLRFQERTDQ